MGWMSWVTYILLALAAVNMIVLVYSLFELAGLQRRLRESNARLLARKLRSDEAVAFSKSPGERARLERRLAELNAQEFTDPTVLSARAISSHSVRHQADGTR